MHLQDDAPGDWSRDNFLQHRFPQAQNKQDGETYHPHSLSGQVRPEQLQRFAQCVNPGRAEFLFCVLKII